MKVYNYEGKNIEEVMSKALKDLNTEEENVVVRVLEEEAGLFKAKKTKLELIVKDEVIEYIKELIKDITSKMGLKVNIECKKRNNYIKINLFSDNNAILIGKAGRTIESLQTIIKYSIVNQTGFFINIILDVEDYKEKQHKHIEILAKRTAQEVKNTGIEVKLDSMNSYERRLVHEALSDIKEVYTVSEGEEPNRCVIIKPRNE